MQQEQVKEQQEARPTAESILQAFHDADAYTPVRQLATMTKVIVSYLGTAAYIEQDQRRQEAEHAQIMFTMSALCEVFTHLEDHRHKTR